MYSERIGRLKSSVIREILKTTSKPGVISFAGGLPSPDLFPVKEIANAAQNALLKFGPSALQYSVTEGIPELREKIAGILDPDSKYIRPQNILITHGSQQGLDLISKLFIDKGTVVFTETPTYLGALQPFRFFQAEIEPIRCDEEGICIDGLKIKIRDLRPELLYLMPNFQNPTGATLSMERRLELVELVKERNLFVIEDDPYGDLVFDGERLPSLLRFGGTENFIYLSTFSKTIAPGFRVAYVAASEEIIGNLAIIKQGTDLHTNTFGQYVISEYLSSDNYSNQIKLIRETYKYRRDCMLSAMKRYFPEPVKWNCPSGGMFLWVQLPEGTDAQKILLQCLDRNVAFVPGQEFFPDGSGKNTVRLNFSNAVPENIEEGIKRIGEVLKDFII